MAAVLCLNALRPAPSPAAVAALLPPRLAAALGVGPPRRSAARRTRIEDLVHLPSPVPMRPAPSGGFVVVEARRDGGLAFDGVRYRLEAVRFRKDGACPLEAVLSFASADAADAAQRRAELELAVPFAVGGDRCADARRAARAVAELMVGLRERPAADLGALVRPGSAVAVEDGEEGGGGDGPALVRLRQAEDTPLAAGLMAPLWRRLGDL